ncbi:MAG: hypothetical protein ACRDHD_06895 [Candidatus Limnocylindria bacterium]
MGRAFRLAFAMQRLELFLLLGAALVLLVGSLLLAWQTRAVRGDELACYAAAPEATEGSVGSPCPQFMQASNLLESGRRIAGGAILLSPFVLGLILGVPIVAREVEGRTAPIAWALSRSRRRWLLHRGAPIAVITLLTALLLGLAGELLTRVAPWNEGVAPGFQDYGGRGALVAVRALAVLSLGLAVGTLLPRQLPALLLAGAATLGLFVAVALGMDAWMAAEAVPVDAQNMQGVGRVFDMAYRDDATGELIGLSDYYDGHGGEIVTGEDGDPEGMTMVAYVIPDHRYPDFVLRESAILAAVTALALGGATAAVGRRRP